MTILTFVEILDGITATLAADPAIKQALTMEDITESVQVVPACLVYIAEFNTDIQTQNSQTTFRGGVRQNQVVVNVDALARRRSHIGEDMKDVTELADVIVAILEAQKTHPYFGLDGLKTFKWRATYATFHHGADDFSALRFILTFMIA